MEIKKITSAQNEYIKTLSKLNAKKNREESGLFLAEGEHLTEMVCNSSYEVKNLVMTEEYYAKNQNKFSCDIIIVPESIMEKISDTKTPQGVVAVVRLPQKNKDIKQGRYIYCDNLQDPGNIGTIIRTADAFSFSGVILSKGCADVFSPKVIRSTQGSIFNIEVITDKDIEFFKKLKADFKLTSTALYGDSVTVKEMKTEKNQIFVIGNEGSGVSEEILSMSDEVVYIPMTGKAESLNAAVAASIVMYEVANRE